MSLKGVVVGGGDDVCARSWPHAGYVWLILASFVAATMLEFLLIIDGCRGVFPFPKYSQNITPMAIARAFVCHGAMHVPTCPAGSLFEESKRSRVPRLILLNLLVGVFTAGVNTWGTLMLLEDGDICEGTAYEWRRNAFNALVWTTWAMLALFVICIVAPLQLMPATEHSSPKSWRFRCMVLACCCCRSKYALAPSGVPLCPHHLMACKIQAENASASIRTAVFSSVTMCSPVRICGTPAPLLARLGCTAR